MGVSGEYFDGNGAAFGVGEQADDDLLVAAFTVEVVAELNDFAVFVLAFEVGAGDVVKDDAAVAEMGIAEGFLDGILTL